MKRALLMLAALAALPALADEPAGLREKLARSLDGAPIVSIRRIDGLGLYEVVWAGSNILYTDAAGEYVLTGNLFRAATRENLTEARKEELLRVDLASLPLDRAMVKVKGNGRRKLVLFSDPDCPYCQNLERELVAVDDVTIYTFLYPLTSIHPDAERKAHLLWCAPDRAKAWDAWMLGAKEPAPAAPGCRAPIAEVQALAKRLNLSGTPGIVFADGRLVPGAIPRARIEALLSAAQPHAAP